MVESRLVVVRHEVHVVRRDEQAHPRGERAAPRLSVVAANVSGRPRRGARSSPAASSAEPWTFAQTHEQREDGDRPHATLSGRSRTSTATRTTNGRYTKLCVRTFIAVTRNGSSAASRTSASVAGPGAASTRVDAGGDERTGDEDDVDGEQQANAADRVDAVGSELPEPLLVDPVATARQRRERVVPRDAVVRDQPAADEREPAVGREQLRDEHGQQRDERGVHDDRQRLVRQRRADRARRSPTRSPSSS